MTDPNFWKIVLGLIFPMAPIPPPEPMVRDGPVTFSQPIQSDRRRQWLQSKVSEWESRSGHRAQPAILDHYRHELHKLDNPPNPGDRNIRYNPLVR